MNPPLKVKIYEQPWSGIDEIKMKWRFGKFEFRGRWRVRLSFPSEIHAIHVSTTFSIIYMTNGR